MATASTDVLTTLSQNDIAQLKTILQSGLGFDKLSDEQKEFLNNLAPKTGRITGLKLFVDLKLNPEIIGLSPLPESEKLLSANLNQVILANVDLYVTDKDAREKLNQQIEAKLADQRETIRRSVANMIAIKVALCQAEIYALRANQNIQKNLIEVGENVNRKQFPLPALASLNQDFVTTVLPQVEEQQKFTITAAQKTLIAQNLASVIIAGTGAGVIDITKPESRNEALEIALAQSVPEYQSEKAALFRQIEPLIIQSDRPEYDSLDPNRIQITPEVKVVTEALSAIQVPPTAPLVSFSFPTDYEEKFEKIKAITTNFVDTVSASNTSDELMANLNGNITKVQRQELLTAVFAGNLVTRVAPTKDGATAVKITAEINPTNSKTLDKTALELYAMGFALRNAEEFLKNNPNSAFAKVVHENPNVLKHLEIADQHLQNTPLGQQIRPSPLTGFGQRIQSLTNSIAGFLPGRTGQVFNFVTHPIQSFQSYLGNFVGSRVVDRFKNVIAQKVVNKLANETLKRGAEFILKEGLQKGVEKLGALALQKLGASALVTGLSAALGVGTGGVSLVIQAALMLASEGAKKIFGALNSLAESIYGEPIEARDLLALPLAALAGLGALLGGLASATAVAASTATVVLIGSSFIGFILYVTVIGVAPIIAGIAQLESGIGVQQGILPSLRYPAYTGAILPGCPSTWPVPPGAFILQGPHGTFSHRTIEAIDIFVPIGTTITSISSGTVTKTGWGNAYGNWIWISSTTEDGRSYSVIYAHLTEIGVAVGDPVGEGSPIALSGATSSVPSYRNPHLHLEYRGIAYNSCPAGGVQIPEGCASARTNVPGACLINNQPIYTN